uniref:Protein krueppel n=1 Tax=Glossina austeni TaxID=7395 RepID=A0A1A9USN0_GLOAU
MNANICRCCLMENPIITYNIFDQTTNLWNELRECSPIEVQIKPDDGLPRVICDLCWLRVQEAIDFRKRCLIADRELRQRYAEHKNKAVEEVLGLIEKLREKDLLESQNNRSPINLPEILNEELDLIDLDNPQTNLLNDFTSQATNEDPVPNNIIESTDSNHCNSSLKPYEIDNNQKGLPRLETTQDDSVRTKKGPFYCPKCEKKFTRNFQLKLHMTSVHKLGSAPEYKCNTCEKIFASLHSLSYHQKSVHSQERPFTCTHCRRQFVLRSQLNSHLRIHTGESKPRTHACCDCGKLWPTKSDLRTHMRSHNPKIERPFKCNECEKSFFTRGHLKSHLLVHTGEKPFSCEYCERAYQSIGNLNNHLIRRHMDEVKNTQYEERENKVLMEL